MTKVHPSAIIDPTAELHPTVEVGPYAIIGPQCRIGEGTVIGPHVVLESHTTLGSRCRVSPGAILGGPPQDLNYIDGVTSFVDIGDDVQIREYVTIHRASQEGKTTRVGSGSLIMAYTHIAHDCQVGEKVVLANNIHMAGYVEIGDQVFISGTCVIHQFVKIGRLTIIGGFSGTRQDVPPFAKAEGRPEVTVHGINVVGLKRNGYGRETRLNLQKAYHLLWYSHLNLHDAIARIQSELPADPCVTELLEFVQNSKRGIRRPNLSGEAGDDWSERGKPIHSISKPVLEQV